MRRRGFFRRRRGPDIEELLRSYPERPRPGSGGSDGPVRQPDWPMEPVLIGENGDFLMHPDDRKYGTLLVGTQGTGKTAAMLRLYGGDIHDPRAAVIVVDPKSELSQVALRNTAPGGKRVWYLDLARPRFGMNPLLRPGLGPLATEAAAVADGIVNSLMDIAQGQVFQSSRRYLYYAVTAALAVAEQRGRPPVMEDVYALLLPEADVARRAAVAACEATPDLDQTAHFFREELPTDLRLASSATAQRMDAPRNKVSLLTGTPPLRRFFNHPTQVSIREIVERREILLVNANMGQIGPENAKACMLFVIHMLGAQMQRQMLLPEAERPRVALLIDEAHYVAASENVVDQVATHRAAGLDVTMGLQYFAQLGAGAGEYEQKIRAGIINLLQSRILFRLGDPKAAEESTKLAMAVYSTLIRDDVESRANQRVTPDAVLNMPRYHAIASWIVGGTRASSFTGQTLPIPDRGDEWSSLHLAAMEEVVGPYPETMAAAKGLEDGFDGDCPVPPQPGADERTGQPPPAALEPPAAAGPPPPADSAPAAQEPAQGDSADEAGEQEAEAPAGSSQPTPFPFASGPLPTRRPQPLEPLDWKALMGATVTPGTEGPPGSERAEAPASEDPADTAPQPPAPTPHQPAAAETPHATSPPPTTPGAATASKRTYRPPPALRDTTVRSYVGLDTARFEPPDLTAGAEGLEAPGLLAAIAAHDNMDRLVPDAMPRKLNAPKRTSPDNLAVLALLDRCGPLPLAVIASACLPRAQERAQQSRMRTLREAGFARRHSVRSGGRRGAAPRVYELTKKGADYARAHGAIHAQREFTPPDDTRRRITVPHDIRAAAYAVAMQDALGRLMDPDWRTAKLETGRLPVPLIGSGRHRHPVTRGELGYPSDRGIIDIPDFFEGINPDLSIELRLPREGEDLLRFDVLVEYDRAQAASVNCKKLCRYDALLGGWYHKVPRYEELGARPAALFVASCPKRLATLVRAADELMVGRYGLYGTLERQCYFPGRDHTFFALESDMHRGSLRAIALHDYPRKLREQLGDELPAWRTVELLPQALVDAHR